MGNLGSNLVPLNKSPGIPFLSHSFLLSGMGISVRMNGGVQYSDTQREVGAGESAVMAILELCVHCMGSSQWWRQVGKNLEVGDWVRGSLMG